MENTHPVGDIALRKIADCIKATIRNKNGLGRFGGEEFLLVLPEESAQTSKLVAERIRNAISTLDINTGDKIIHATASFGVACAHPTESDYHAALKRADLALYEAKNTGRNKVIIYQDQSDR